MPKKAINKKSAAPKAKSSTKSPKRKFLPWLIVGLLALGTILLLTQVQQKQQTVSRAAGDCTVSATDLAEKPMEQEFFKLINDYRTQNGAPALILSKELRKPAQWLTNDMVAKNYLEHTDSLGRDVEKRITECGITIQNGEAENILNGDKTAQEAFDTWKNSPGHNQNMLDAENKQIGIGITEDTWATVFLKDDPNAKAQTNAVPSPNCLGPCATGTVRPAVSPSASVSAAPVSTAPTAVVPSQVSPSPVTIPAPVSNNDPGPLGFIVLFLKLILSIFQNLF